MRRYLFLTYSSPGGQVPDTKKFFAACKKADRARGLDFTRTDIFRERLLQKFLRMALRKGDLRKGRYRIYLSP